MSDFDVTAVELRVAAHALRTLGSDARADLSSVSARVDDLTGDLWTGAASAEFAREFARWRAGALEGLSALELMCDALDASAADYSQTDSGASNSIHAAGGSL